jgi:hypothetical protein
LLKNLKTITGLEPELYAASISDIQGFISADYKKLKILNGQDITQNDQEEFESIDLSKLEDVKLRKR